MKQPMLRTVSIVLVLVGAAEVRAETRTAAEAADAAARTALKDGPFAGIAVAVSRGGKVVYQHGFGFADVDRKIPVNADTRFPVGSITKPITCLAVQQLATRAAWIRRRPPPAIFPALPHRRATSRSGISSITPRASRIISR